MRMPEGIGRRTAGLFLFVAAVLVTRALFGREGGLWAYLVLAVVFAVPFLLAGVWRGWRQPRS